MHERGPKHNHPNRLQQRARATIGSVLVPMLREASYVKRRCFIHSLSTPKHEPMSRKKCNRSKNICPQEIARRRLAMEARGADAWSPGPRERKVSGALKAYAALTTSAARGAVRDVSGFSGS